MQDRVRTFESSKARRQRVSGRRLGESQEAKVPVDFGRGVADLEAGPHRSFLRLLHSPVSLLLLVLLLSSTAGAQETTSGVYIGEIEDNDGDLQILMESKWISMHIMPSESMTIVRFVFRPTGNDILADVQPKFIRGGGGLFQDNLWEQDWRFQELRSRFYDYKILERGPQQAKLVFQTKTIGYIGYVNSGIISRLLSNITIRRTITLREDTPFFRVDIELINDDPDGFAKLPMYWPHHSALFSVDFGDQVHRPSARGVRSLGGKYPCQEHYIWDFNEGWTATMSEGAKEGIVYLMDYDYVLHLYNCYTTTAEWMYDNVLILKDRPWKSVVYIIPVMGLSRVDHANKYFVMEIQTKRTKETLTINYLVTSSYEKAHKISFNTSISYDHLKGEPKTRTLPSVEIEKIGLEPRKGVVPVENPPGDPFVLTITAYVELPDGKMEKYEIQSFQVGEYGYGDNVRPDLKTPVALLKHPPQKPFVPIPAADQEINRKEFNVFGLIGCNTRAYGLDKALKLLGVAKFDRGDCPGYRVAQNGLTDFPYDYDRLFKYRVVLYSNCDEQILRKIGASILIRYMQKGGGVVFFGGDNAFTIGIPDHEFADYLPFKPKMPSIRRGVLQLNSPRTDHPIFQGIDLKNLPYSQYYHELEMNPALESKVLLKLGDQPFIVESEKEGARIMTVLCVPFFDPESMPKDKPHYLQWADWPKLLANVIRYAGREALPVSK